MPVREALPSESAALVARSAELCKPFRPPIAGGSDSDSSLIIEAIGKGGPCLDCLVSKTRLPMESVAGGLRRLSDGVTISVGVCSSCGETDRLICGR